MEELETKKYAGIDLGRTSVQFSIYREGQEEMTEESFLLSEEEQKEYMLLGLRKIQGIDIQEFKNKFIDNPIYIFHKELEKLVKEELIEVDLNQIKLTSKGLDFANLVWEEFV